jgi:hypothetical protein
MIMRMPRDMQDITCDMVRELVNNNPDARFDNHWIEMRILRHHAIEFASELLHYRGRPDPLKDFSREFSHWVGRKFRGHLIKTDSGPKQDGKIESRNLAGDLIFNQEWEKSNPGTPIPASVCT